jgi:hypothetical protein
MSNYQQVKNALGAVCLAGGHQEELLKDAIRQMDAHYVNSGAGPHPSHENKRSSTASRRGSSAGRGASVEPPLTQTPAVKGSQFLVLFYQSKALSFRGIYIIITPTNTGAHADMPTEILKIYGRGPRLLEEAYIDEYFKFETASRSFKKLPSRSLTHTTDAVSIDPAKMKRLLGT